VCVVVLAVVLFVLADPVADLIYASDDAQPGAYLVRQVAVFLPFATITLLLLAATRGFGGVGAFVGVEQVFKPLARPLTVGVVCLVGAGVSAAFLAWVLPVLVGLAMAGFALRGQLTRLERAQPDLAEVVTAREFWGFAVPRALGGTLEILAPWFGVVMLSGLTGSADAGVFTAVVRVVMAGTMLLVAMRLAMGPHLSEAFARGDLRRLEALHEHATTWGVLLSFPFLLAVAFVPETTLSLFGADFPRGSTALVILALANLVNVAVGNVQSIVLMGGRSSWNLGNTAVALALQAGLGAALIPSYGLAGAAIGFAAGVVANNALSFWQTRNGLGLRVWSRGVLTAVGLTSVLFISINGIVRYLLGHAALDMLLANVVAVAVEALVILCRPGLFNINEGWRVLTQTFGPPGTTK
jgi:O-antigen/teichoic acid export membrane protein